MSKRQKLLDRFCECPKDFRWEELVRLLDDLGFDLDQSGGGSHHKFIWRQDRSIVINAYRPHPEGVMYRRQLKEINRKLKEMGVIEK